MSGQQDTKTTTPIQIFKKALITTMLEKRRILVTREEVRKYLPRDFDDGEIDTSNYVLSFYDYDSDSDILSLPKILELFTESEKQMLRFLDESQTLFLSIEKIDAAAREYLELHKNVTENALVEMLLDEAEKYFEIKKVERDRYGVKEAVFDGNKLITKIWFDSYEQSYNFFVR